MSDAGDKFQIIVEEQQRGEDEGKWGTLKNYFVIALDVYVLYEMYMYCMKKLILFI